MAQTSDGRERYLAAKRENQEAVRKLIESGSIYGRTKELEFGGPFDVLLPLAANGYCRVCREIRTFSQPIHSVRLWAGFRPKGELDTDEGQHALSRTLVSDDAIGKQPGQLHAFVGLCSYCHESDLIVLIVFDGNRAIKIGQNVAPWEKPVDRTLEKALGEDIALYRKAVTLESESFGVGACAYLRRLLENQIDPMMTSLIEFKQAVSATDEEIGDLERIRTSKDFSAKATEIYHVLPEHIRIDGHNPLITLHRAYSAGMHGLSDEECVEIAKDTLEALAFVLTHLAERPRQRRSYVDKIKELDRG